MDREDIAEVLFSFIKEDDPYRASKLLQIERWCYAHWKIHAGYCDIRNNVLAQVLSDKECWKTIDGLHGVKLDRQMVGKKLTAPGSDNNPNHARVLEVACELNPARRAENNLGLTVNVRRIYCYSLLRVIKVIIKVSLMKLNYQIQCKVVNNKATAKLVTEDHIWELHVIPESKQQSMK